MVQPEEDRIRLRAYQIWEREGRPRGQEQEHWERARREVEREDSAMDTVLDGAMEVARAPEPRQKSAPRNRRKETVEGQSARPSRRKTD